MADRLVRLDNAEALLLLTLLHKLAEKNLEAANLSITQEKRILYTSQALKNRLLMAKIRDAEVAEEPSPMCTYPGDIGTVVG